MVLYTINHGSIPCMPIINIKRKQGDLLNKISQETKKRCIELSNQGRNSKQIYLEFYSQHYDTAYTGFKKMLQRWKKKVEVDDAILETANLGYGFSPHDATVQVGKDGSITQTWVKSKASDSMYMQLIDTIKTIKPFEPIELIKEDCTERMLEIKYDDLHFGVAFLEDYKETLQNTIGIIQAKIYEEINIPIGEDLLHANDFTGKTNKGTYLGEVDTPRSFKDALSFYSTIIIESLKHSKKVNVIYSVGNHSESLSWAIVQVLKAMYPQVNYDDSLDERKVIIYKKIFIGISHCEETTGNLRDIKDIFVQEFTKQYADAETREIHLGHLHHSKETEDINGCVVRRLPSGVPSDRYTKRHGWTGTVKRFLMFEYSANKIKHIHYI